MKLSIAGIIPTYEIKNNFCIPIADAKTEVLSVYGSIDEDICVIN